MDPKILVDNDAVILFAKQELAAATPVTVGTRSVLYPQLPQAFIPEKYCGPVPTLGVPHGDDGMITTW